MEDEDRRCGTCHWWRYGLVTPVRASRRCQRRAPNAATRDGYAMFPEMPEDGECGDWEAIRRKAS